MKRLMYLIRSIRWFEIAVRTGAPAVAILIVSPELNLATGIRIIHSFIAFFFLWAHGYTFNEWGGYDFDKNDTSKAETPLLAGHIAHRELLILSIVFGVISIIMYSLLDIKFLLIVIFDIVMGIVYVHPKILLKSMPIASLIILFVISINDFLLGWLIFSPDIFRGLLIGIYFGILGISGQNFHEAGDHDSDKKANIKTNAVRFGKKYIFILGFIFYTLSLIYFVILSLTDVVPECLYIILVVTYPIYVAIFCRCLKSGIETSNVHHFVKKYRLLYGVIGLCFILLLLLGK
jgi:4-hydroxybenzoate polyprenyltransferase